jgi:hypothetical protein
VQTGPETTQRIKPYRPALAIVAAFRESLISVSNDPLLVSVRSCESLTPAVMLPVLVIEVKSMASPAWKPDTVAAKPAGSPRPSVPVLVVKWSRDVAATPSSSIRSLWAPRLIVPLPETEPVATQVAPGSTVIVPKPEKLVPMPVIVPMPVAVASSRVAVDRVPKPHARWIRLTHPPRDKSPHPRTIGGCRAHLPCDKSPHPLLSQCPRGNTPHLGAAGVAGPLFSAKESTLG